MSSEINQSTQDKVVGENIRRIRESRGISANKLAEKLEISPTYLGYYEKGKRTPKRELLSKIADVLDVNVIELYAVERNEINAMHYLFKFFKAFEGSLMKKEDKVYISFGKLDEYMLLWHKKLEETNRNITKLKIGGDSENPINMNTISEEAFKTLIEETEKFNNWMRDFQG